MHRLVDAQPRNVWPVEHAKARIRHLLAIVKRLEGDIPGLRCWLEALEKRAERERSEEHTSELQSLMRISYAVFCLKKKNTPATDATSIDNMTTHLYITNRTVDCISTKINTKY